MIVCVKVERRKLAHRMVDGRSMIRKISGSRHPNFFKISKYIRYFAETLRQTRRVFVLSTTGETSARYFLHSTFITSGITKHEKYEA